MSDLEQFATTRQWEYYQAYQRHGSIRKAAKALRVDQSTLGKAIASLKQKAARQGYSPDHDMVHTVPDGFTVKGVSTYYDKEGNPTGQWVKSQADRERQLEILMERLESAHKGVKPFKPTASPKVVDDDFLTLLTVTDFHFGMKAWEAETGESWDLEIARQTFMDSINAMIDASPKSGIAVLNQMGDFLHWDGLDAVTPSSGHILDADTRYGKVVELAMLVMCDAIKLMLKKFGKVIVVNAEGNHDLSGSVWLRKHIKHMFSGDKRVIVEDNEFPYYAYLHGQTMLGFHHGHLSKMVKLPALFSAEPRFRAMWGAATRCYIHTGHYHHERKVEDAGAIVEQHPTLAARDSYSTRGGYVSSRGAKVHVYHKTDGETACLTIRPR